MSSPHIPTGKRSFKHPPMSRTQSEKLNLNPLSWKDFFIEEHWYSNPGSRSGNFHCYTTGTHGKPCIVLVHGGGYSALTFAVLAEYLFCQIGSDVEIFAPDLRGHGSTDADDNDLELNTFSDDIIALLHEHFEARNGGIWPEIILVGHSLGGAIAVDVAFKLPKCFALVCLDVTESIAMESLSGMKSVLRGRPSSFVNVQAAVYWALCNKTITNVRSARVSVPAMIKNEITNELASNEKHTATIDPDTITPFSKSVMEAVVEEPDEDGVRKEAPASTKSTSPISEKRKMEKLHEEKEKLCSYIWRINLQKTEPFWAGWYQNMSQKFLSVSTQAKLLILARSTDALDRDAEMLRGHITGKFSFQTIPHSGHMLHENDPEGVGVAIIQLLKRHRLLIPVGHNHASGISKFSRPD